MYDYRRMSPEQREAIVEHRRARAFPLHKPPHPEQGAGWYLITAATYQHRRHFREARELTALEYRLREALAGAGLACAGWVVLPNHYHLLIKTSKLSDVGRAVGGVHGRAGLYANRRDGTAGRQVWYKYSDRKIRSDRHFWAALHYVIINPVRHRYVDRIDEWAWSCYGELLEQYGHAGIDDLIRLYPVFDFGDNWDPPDL